MDEWVFCMRFTDDAHGSALDDLKRRAVDGWRISAERRGVLVGNERTSGVRSPHDHVVTSSETGEQFTVRSGFIYVIGPIVSRAARDG